MGGAWSHERQGGTCYGFGWTLPPGKADGRVKPVVLESMGKPCQEQGCRFFAKTCK